MHVILKKKVKYLEYSMIIFNNEFYIFSYLYLYLLKYNKNIILIYLQSICISAFVFILAFKIDSSITYP